ncbi:hypothetical protein AAF712_011577 [Marasmius tenuissimus]|uniref:Uncharacterized protein n=1 Tax=Marasmius tenuissimus TaxID=585030 RepID=A0ABR2ZIP8_9AGAR
MKLVGMFDPRQRSAPFFLPKIWYLGFGVVLSGGRGPRAISRLYLFTLLNDHFPAKSVDYVQNLEVGSTKSWALGSGNAVESAGLLANIPASRLALSPAVLCFRPPCPTFLKTWSINDYQETAYLAYLGNPENDTLNSLYEVYSDIGSEAEDKEGHDQDVNMEESDPDRPYTPAGILLPFPTHSEVHAYAFLSIFDRYIKFTFTFPIAITITSTLATPLIPTCLSRRQSRIRYIRHATVHENNQDVPHSAPRDLSAPTHHHRRPEVQETNLIRRNRLSQEPKRNQSPQPNTVFVIDPNRIIRIALGYPSTFRKNAHKLLLSVHTSSVHSFIPNIQNPSFINRYSTRSRESSPKIDPTTLTRSRTVAGRSSWSPLVSRDIAPNSSGYVTPSSNTPEPVTHTKGTRTRSLTTTAAAADRSSPLVPP